MVDKDGLFFSGIKGRETGAVVRHQVFVHVDWKNGPKESTVAIALHEIPILRRRARLTGETVTINPSWTRGIQRVQGVNRAKLEDIRSTLERDHVHQHGNANINLFHEVYGGVNGGKCTLFECMSKLYSAWREMIRKLEERGQRLSAESIEAVLSVIAPKDESDQIEPDPIFEDPMPAPSFADKPAADAMLIEFLVSRQTSDEVAHAFAAAVASHPIGESWTEEEWATVPGLGKGTRGVSVKRQYLLNALAAYNGG